MKKMTKWMIALLAGVLMICMMASCGSSEQASDTEDDSIKIVATIFPEYDWVMNILGENPAGADVTLLLDDGVDLHSFQPTAGDIQAIADCDLFLYVGGESDTWVEDALQEATNENMVTVNLLETLGDQAKEEEEVEGMEPEDEESSEAEEEGPEYDEHVWLSLKNASVLIQAITDALCEIDAEHAAVYRQNFEAYEVELTALDDQYTDAARSAKVKTLLFGDRFPFRYMTDDYGLDYYAAFNGCSAETEASFETITFLAEKVDELGLRSVMTIEGSDQKVAETIIRCTKDQNQTIRTLDSMQAVTAKDVEEGASYTSIMERNLDVLKEALESK